MMMSLRRCRRCGLWLPAPTFRVCPGCGFYNGQLVVAIEAKKGKGEEGQA